MDLYNIAGLTVAMDAMEGGILQKRTRQYMADGCCRADIQINMDQEQRKMGEHYPHLSAWEWEYIWTGFAFARELTDFDGFCFHASAVALDHQAVLFSAPSGTGKSTHTSLWLRYFGEDRAVIINDDKPAIRMSCGEFYAYGTPWSGKHDQSANVGVPLQAIVFLEQAPQNHIKSLDSAEAVRLLLYQTLRPSGYRDKMDALLTLLDKLLLKVPVYKLGCTISTDAVRLAYDTINKGRIEQK